jgi:hypothetical protein
MNAEVEKHVADDFIVACSYEDGVTCDVTDCCMFRHSAGVMMLKRMDMTWVGHVEELRVINV